MKEMRAMDSVMGKGVTLESAARRLLAAGSTAASQCMRVYLLIGYSKDTFDLAERRLHQLFSIGFTPMAKLWQPQVPSKEKYKPKPTWQRSQKRWAIIHCMAA